MELTKEDSKQQITLRKESTELQIQQSLLNGVRKKSFDKEVMDVSLIDDSTVIMGGLNNYLNSNNNNNYINNNRESIESSQGQSIIITNTAFQNTQLNNSKQLQGQTNKLNETRTYQSKLALDDLNTQKASNSRRVNQTGHCKKTLNLDEDYKFLERKQEFVFRSSLHGKSNFIPSIKYDPKIVWKKGFFQIIRYVNRFIYTMKKTLIFRKPYLLKEHQINAIADKGAKQFTEGFGQKNKKFAKVVRSNIKILRKIRIMSLMMKKSLKFIINPYTQFRNKCFRYLEHISKKIPVIMPYSKISNFTDFMHGLLILFFLVTVPFELSFDYKIPSMIKEMQLSKKKRFLREQFHMQEKTQIFIQLVILFFQTFLMCHFFACTFFFIARLEQENSMNNWVDHYSAIQDNPVSDGMLSRYIVSLYFSVILIGTIGFGDFVPQTEIEMVCVLFFGFIASGYFGFVLSQIGGILREANKKQEKFKIRLKELNRYLNHMDVSQSLQIQARKYLEYVNKEGSIYSNQLQSLNQLSKYLREGIFKEIYVKSLMSIPYLKQNFSTAFIQKLSLSMKETSFGPDELILKRGVIEEECLFIVASGEVEIFMDTSQDINKLTHSCIKPFKKLKKGDHFGATEFFANKKYSLYNVRSLGVSRIQYLQLREFRHTIDEFPYDKEVFSYIKDNFVFNSNYYMLHQNCISCSSSAHLVQNCPILFYSPHQIRVIKIYNKNNEIIRSQFKRKLKRVKHQTLSESNKVENEVEKFIVENNRYLDASTYLDITNDSDSYLNEDDDDDEEGEGNLPGQNKPFLEITQDKEETNLQMVQGENISHQFQLKNTTLKALKKVSNFSSKEKQLQNISENVHEEEMQIDSQMIHENQKKSEQFKYKYNIQNPITSQEKIDQSQLSHENKIKTPKTVAFADDQVKLNYDVSPKSDLDLEQQKEYNEEKKASSTSIKTISINNIVCNKHQQHFAEEDYLSNNSSNQQLNPNILMISEFKQKFNESTLQDLDNAKKQGQENSEAASSSNIRKQSQSNSKNNSQSIVGNFTSQNSFKTPIDLNPITLNEKQEKSVKSAELDFQNVVKIQKKLLLRKNKTDQQKSKDDKLKKQGKTVDLKLSPRQSISNLIQALIQNKQPNIDLLQKQDQCSSDILKNSIQMIQEQRKLNNNFQQFNQMIQKAQQPLQQIQTNNLNFPSLMHLDLPTTPNTNVKSVSQVNLKNLDDQDIIKMNKLIYELNKVQLNGFDTCLDSTCFFDKHPFDAMKTYKVYFPNYNYKLVVLQSNKIMRNLDRNRLMKKTMADRKKTFHEHKKKTNVSEKNKTKILASPAKNNSPSSSEYQS
ncbi:cyclic nucleotide-binding domain protein (macronuclear) [Tetrahymena thermophila SB210]|uniref:Cyclic nucleotide-binding domain protein n=1 Tax=Tetrahymena thermophila (strain SB210) TaxID=312017 RepID=I7MG16_TETTS|nr:cyclic nucleotide-binding domain protein [Tetrahymena thermophila SB210]EAS00888.2 cyclic nucleotide-binding domain protein [Tetrahymena thermophila SB210]|eukprot:XP_001021134.2 cyclic nucleotide-binding domain protein [Tetrahymena thermophila SB210]